jgi:hypothetical protein
MYPKGCKKTTTGSTFSTNGVLKLMKDGATVATVYVYDFDNYGFVNQNFPAGNYTALFQATWHPDDVKDFTFRIYMNSSITIQQVAYNATAMTLRGNQADYTTGLTTIKSTAWFQNSTWYAYRGTWVNNNYFLQLA